MRKKQQTVHRSRQEQVISALTEKSFGASGVFHPKQWSDGREPADMALLIGRSLFLFNMKDTKDFFETATAKNLKQLTDRIADWRKGRQLRGSNSFRDFAVDWSDVDTICAVSVVDGPHAACCIRSTAEVGHAEKVVAAMSISGSVMQYLADHSGGAPELIYLFQHLKSDPWRHSTEEVILAIEARRTTAFADYWQLRDDYIKGASRSRRLIGVPQDVISFFLSLRNHKVLLTVSAIACLDWFDIAFIGNAILNGCHEVQALPREAYKDFTLVKRLNKTMRFGVAVGSSAKIIADNMEEVLRIQGEEHLTFVYFSSPFFDSTLGQISANPIAHAPELVSKMNDLR